MEFKKLILGRNLIGSNLVCYNLYEDESKITRLLADDKLSNGEE